jgi:SH3 domain protein
MYITDSFSVTLRTGPSGQHRVISILKSNDEAEVLEKQDDYSKVRLKNGKEGYILSRFLTTDVPKPLVITGLQRQIEKMKKESSDLNEAKRHLGESASQLKSVLSSREKELTKIKRNYDELKSGSTEYIEVKELKDKLEIRNKYLESRADDLLEENRQPQEREKQPLVCQRSRGFASGVDIRPRYGTHPDTSQTEPNKDWSMISA